MYSLQVPLVKDILYASSVGEESFVVIICNIQKIQARWISSYL